MWEAAAEQFEEGRQEPNPARNVEALKYRWRYVFFFFFLHLLLVLAHTHTAISPS